MPVEVSYTTIPAELRERPQWVLWRYVKKPDGKWTKIPYQAANPRVKASSTEPVTWGKFEQAVAAADQADGIGFVFSVDDPYTGIDFDEITPEVEQAIAKLDSYTEMSVSGRGAHTIVKGSLTGDRHRRGKFEVYDSGRYFCMTGVPLNGHLKRAIELTPEVYRPGERRVSRDIPCSSAAAHEPVDKPISNPFVDWQAFWSRDREEADWIYPDVLARGRGHAIYATHKEGKSLFTLFVVAQVATGPEKVVVAYFDYEMGEHDLYDRLEDMGYGAESDLSRLCYALLPTFASLDTAAGAKAFIALIDQVTERFPDHHLVVVIDTIGRAVDGEENSSDTFRDFFRHTGAELKRRGITWARLDHGGKDPARGQRGSSSKGDDVDIVWKLTRTQDGITLARELARMSWVPEKVSFSIMENPLRFQPAAFLWPAGTKETAEMLDRLGVALDAAVRVAQAALKEAGEGRRQQVVRAALRWRRELRGGAF